MMDNHVCTVGLHYNLRYSTHTYQFFINYVGVYVGDEKVLFQFLIIGSETF